MLFAKDHTTKIAVTGLGGVGKTQLVLELLYRMKDKHKHCSIIWIPATNMESLHQAYTGVARELGILGWKEEKADVKSLVQGYLSKDNAGPWLLVMDNADDIEMWIAKPGSTQGSSGLIDYLPRSKQGCIVFTTRDRKTAVKLAHQNVVEIPEMDEEVATRLLQKCLVHPELVNNRKEATALLAELTYLPLAIVQAAAYINENRIALADYLSLLEEQEEEVIDLLSEAFEDDGRYRNVKNPVATTWVVSFEQIRRRDPLAADYLSFMSCVDPKGIPQPLLPPGSSRKKEIDAIGTLNAYSFLSRRSVDLALDLHRLVHLATRNWLRKEELLAQSTESVIERLEEVFPDDNHKDRKVWRMYLPHVRYALESDLVNKDGRSRIDLAWRYGTCLYSDGRWKEAEISFGRVMEARKRVLGEDHPSTLTSMANLASTYRKQGRWDQAEELEVQVVETSKGVFGTEHPDTLTSMANLASTYWYQGRWKEAEKLEIQVMETRKQVLGTEHPHTLTSISNLAETCRDQGRWSEAEELGIQVMEMSKRVLGAEHPDTLVSMAELALTYWKQGRYNKAEELGAQVLASRKIVLGEEHPYTLKSMATLAATYRNQGRSQEAEELEVQVLETQKRVLGVEHPSTLISIDNLAWVYNKQERLKEAEKLQLEVTEINKRMLGAEHPHTLISIDNLASTYRKQKRWKDAGELQLQATETFKRVLGMEHPDTLTSMVYLAFTWKGMKRDAEAIKLMEECIQLRKRILGTNHPDTMSASAALTGWQREKLDASVFDG
jgi:tetratricopeptide (TPR) repeat protein